MFILSIAICNYISFQPLSEHFLTPLCKTVKRSFTLLFFMYTTNYSMLVYSQEIKLVTEEYPPFNYFENNNVIGISTEIAQAVAKEAGVTYTTSLYSWARAYDMALNTENVLIFSLARTIEREDLFKWVGVVSSGDFCLFSLKRRDDIVANTIDSVHSYRIGVIKGDVQEKYLLNQPDMPKINLNAVYRHQQLYNMLLAERIDLWAAAPLTAYYISQKNNTDPNFILKRNHCYRNLSKSGVYLAFSNKTEDKIVNKFKKALKKVKSDDTYEKILKKYVGRMQ